MPPLNLLISPYEGVGPIKLGMTQSQVRNAIGGEFDSFMKTPDSEMPTDDFIGKGIHVYYKLPGICKAIELHPPSNPIFRGNRLIGMPFGPLCVYFQRIDTSVKVEENGMNSPLFGIDLYVPDLDHGPEAPVKAVIVFERGYYDAEC